MIDDEHWVIPNDRETTLAGRFYVGWPGAVYELLSHHPCGFHLVNVRDPLDRHCISERAIGGTYHEMHEVPLDDLPRRVSAAADAARSEVAALGDRAVVYFRGGHYHVVPVRGAQGRYR